MRRFLMLIAAVLLLVFSGIAFASPEIVDHITIGNLTKVAGGNSNIELVEITDRQGFFEDFAVKYENGFDTKEEIKRGLEKDPDAKLGLPFSYFQKFDDEVWADMKYRIIHEKDDVGMVVKGGISRAIASGYYNVKFEDLLRDGLHEKFKHEDFSMPRSVSLVPECKGVNKPVPANKIPNAKNGLINPNNPIFLTAFTNKIIIDLTNEHCPPRSYIRLIDNKGKLIGSVRDQKKPAEIILPKDKGTYYLELKGLTEIYYIMLNIDVDPVKPTENKGFTNHLNEIRKTTKQAEKNAKVMNDYMNEKGISDADDITDEDAIAMANRVSEVNGEGGVILSQQQIIDNYMKENNISSMMQLTEKDMNIIGKRIIKNSILSLPAAQRSVVDSYMKKNKIKSYDDITEKDMEKISKLIEKQVSETKKSSKNKTKRKSK